MKLVSSYLPSENISPKGARRMLPTFSLSSPRVHGSIQEFLRYSNSLEPGEVRETSYLYQREPTRTLMESCLRFRTTVLLRPRTRTLIV